MRPFVLATLTLLVIVPFSSGLAQTGTDSIETRSLRLSIPAVGQAEDGSYVGLASTLTVTMQTPGTGQVYLSTQPLTQLDMQGSARLAVATAETVSGISASGADFFFLVKTSSSEVGGPSAGGAMAVAAMTLLQGWTLNPGVVMTGMINPDGTIGPVGGIPQKLEAVASAGGNTFLVPLGQAFAIDENTGEAVDLKEIGQKQYGINVIEVADLYEAMGPFTGHRLERQAPTTNPLEDATYRELTANLSRSLNDRVAARLANASLRYNAVQGDIVAEDRALIDQQISAASERLRLARESANASRHYEGSSSAFQALVALGFAEGLITFFEEDSSRFGAYAQRYYVDTESRLQAMASDVKPHFPMPASRIDAQAAAELRYLEALRAQSLAGAASDRGEALEAVRQSSFARERADSARWWLDIAAYHANASASKEVTMGVMVRLLDRYAEAAELNIQYADLIARNSALVGAAKTAFARARSAEEQSYPTAALYGLVHALAQVATALVSLAGVEPVQKRLAQMEDAAAFEIELAQSKGVPPVYALSLLELGNTRGGTDPTAAYEAYSEARLSARTSLLAAAIEPSPPDVLPYTPPPAVARGHVYVQAILAGLALQGVAALVVATVLIRRRPNEETTEAAPDDARSDAVAPAFVPGPPVWARTRALPRTRENRPR